MVMDLERNVGPVLSDWKEPAWPENDVMSGRYVRLEPLSDAAHARDLYAVNQADARIWDYLPYGPFTDFDAYQGWVASVQGARDPFFFALIDQGTGKAAGVASYLRITPVHGVIEVGHINYSPALQSTPAATEAMFLMADWVFRAGYRRYEWKCDALNLPSRRAAERLGFSYEGTFRQHMIYKGRNRDTAWFAMTDKDWPALRAAYLTWLDPANFDGDGQQKVRLSDLIHPLLVIRDPVFLGQASKSP